MTEDDREAGPRLSIRAAARVAGVSERTMRRYVASGKVSVTEDGTGARLVDTSELLRLGLLRQAPMTPAAMAPVTAPDETDSLRERLAAAEDRCRELASERDAWRGQAASWQAQAEGLLRMLPQAPPEPQETPEKRPWWRRKKSR